MGEITLVNSAGRLSITLKAISIGDDLLVYITGGSPHMGAVAAGTYTGGMATSSVITMPGHRDDRIVKDAAEKLSKQLKTNVVVVAGIHYDDITIKEINETLRLCDELIDGLVGELCKKE